MRWFACPQLSEFAIEEISQRNSGNLVYSCDIISNNEMIPSIETAQLTISFHYYRSHITIILSDITLRIHLRVQHNKVKLSHIWNAPSFLSLATLHTLTHSLIQAVLLILFSFDIYIYFALICTSPSKYVSHWNTWFQTDWSYTLTATPTPLHLNELNQ